MNRRRNPIPIAQSTDDSWMEWTGRGGMIDVPTSQASFYDEARGGAATPKRTTSYTVEHPPAPTVAPTRPKGALGNLIAKPPTKAATPWLVIGLAAAAAAFLFLGGRRK